MNKVLYIKKVLPPFLFNFLKRIYENIAISKSDIYKKNNIIIGALADPKWQWQLTLLLENIKVPEKYKYLFKYSPDSRILVDCWANTWKVIDLACPASPVHYQKNPVETMKSSILWAINMLDLATKVKARILQASTSEVYGDPLIHPQPESYWGNVNILWSRSCYDEGKRAAETLFMDYHREYGTDIRIIRIFNTYGPNMHPADGRVVSNFIMQALENKDITIFGTGEQSRSFQYIDDLIRGMIAMMDNQINFIWPVNIGTEYEFTIKELANNVISMIPWCTSKIVYQELPWDDPKQRRADNRLAKERLGWEPTIELREWLLKTIEYFRNHFI